MIVASIKATVPPGRIKEALQLVRDILGPTKARPGCAGVSFYQDTDDPDTMVLLEEWEDRSSLEDHIRSDSYRNILALMDLSTKAPEDRGPRFGEIADVAGKMRDGTLILSRLKWIKLCMLMALFVFVSSGAAADVEKQAGAEESDPRNKISFFGGNTQDGSENGVSVGLEYEYAMTRYFGAGGLLEYAGGDFDSWVLGVPIFVHPYRGLFFLAAPGVEIEDSDTNFLFRIGVGYELEFLPRWSIAPEFNVDFSDGDTKLVYGLTLSWAF